MPILYVTLQNDVCHVRVRSVHIMCNSAECSHSFEWDFFVIGYTPIFMTRDDLNDCSSMLNYTKIDHNLASVVKHAQPENK